MAGTNSIGDVLSVPIAAGELAGAAALVWRNGGVDRIAAIGRRDLVSGAPVERDTIFRLASVTKPVTTVAALALLDEGRFALDQPITDCAPELARLRVLRDPDGPLDQTDDTARPMTVRDLLTHRSGLTYGDFHRGPIGRAYSETLGPTLDNPLTPDAWIDRLATLPLIDQPAKGFHYGHSTDLLGFLIARLDGAPLSQVLDRRVLTPLGMRDTFFTVPPSKRDRCAGLCGVDDEGRLTALTEAPGGQALNERPEGMTFESGGQGLWSTLDDYLALARMLIADRRDGATLLSPGTRAMMTSNQLTPEQRATARMFGQSLFAAGHGYGHGRGGRHGTGAGGSAAVSRRPRHDRLAGGVRELVAGRSDRRLGADLPRPQHAGTPPDGPRRRPRCLERDRGISCRRERGSADADA